jgi:hypothetical protein
VSDRGVATPSGVHRGGLRGEVCARDTEDSRSSTGDANLVRFFHPYMGIWGFMLAFVSTISKNDCIASAIAVRMLSTFPGHSGAPKTTCWLISILNASDKM